ncbi:MAG: PilT/PilU family type 4a pilus ATPase [Planctomycetota bacterium]|jgi:twitching motility protein PilT|nr:PilT/PilU family type 4a pilus ATPase [Planctomycetota bacterium]MDP7250187.1 PilT/PilU family type 4a pilus ATPase [Planctomycetota bacterium]
MAQMDSLLNEMKAAGASDLHMVAGQPPKVRIHGSLIDFGERPRLTDESLKALLREMCDSRAWETFVRDKDLDFAYSLPGVARFRCNYFQQIFGAGAVFRIIPQDIQTLEDLGIADTVRRLSELQSGLVLVTGPTGCGKSTTLAAMIDHINTQRSCRVLTIEDPIEFVHQNKKAVILQREVGRETRSFADALRSTSREDVDVILVGDMRDLETISLALTAAEMGALVLGTLHTNSAAKTVARIIDAFPSERQAQAQTMLAESLSGVVAQLLLRSAEGDGRVAVIEILVGSPALASMVRQGQLDKITSYIQTGRGEGMVYMDDAIEEKLNEGLITPREAYMRSQDKSRFEKLIGDDLI